MSALQEFSDRLLRQLDVPSQPPVDVDLLARQLRVRVREDALRGGVLGYVSVDGMQLCITLRRGLSGSRRRFVLAHELGHVLCSDTDLRATSLRRRLRMDQERFCDRFAEAVLMPRGWLQAFSERPPSLDALFDCSRQARVSASAAAIALHRGAGWQRTLIRLQRRRGSWNLLAVAGHLPFSPSALATSSALDRSIAQCKGRLTSTRLPLVIDGAEELIPAEGVVRESSALLLLDLRSSNLSRY